MRALKLCCAALLKLRTPRKAGPMSKRAESVLTALRAAAKFVRD
jgi:hypothetical protein